MAKVGFIKGAEEKYKLLMNGIKGSVDNFIKELVEEKIKIEDLTLFLERKEHNFKIYSKNLEKIYVILNKGEKDNIWIIFDFLTPQEFNRIK